jgi:beta-xylosidase
MLQTRRLVRSLFFIFACLAPVACVTSFQRAAQERPIGFFTNPLVQADWPDPGILAVKDKSENKIIYYLVSTGGTFPIKRSTNLIQWQPTGAELMPEGKPAWAPDGLRNWAPEIHKIGNRYVAYYTASAHAPDSKRPDPLAIGTAWSDHILGPYHHLDQPLVPAGEYGTIDPTLFSDNGRLYLYWKTDGNCCGGTTNIMAQELEADGLAFKAGSQPQVVLSSDLAWENNLIEAPWLIRRNEWIYLFYSASAYGVDYKNGIARSRSPLGPFEKKPTPFLVGDDVFRAPGHGSVLNVGNSKNFVFLHHAFHSWDARSLTLTPLSWQDGWPFVAASVPRFGTLAYDD